MSNLTASASYLLAAIADATDHDLATEAYEALFELLPFNLRGELADAYVEALALA